jgi:DNA-binding LytR/AlgR family response regulator
MSRLQNKSAASKTFHYGIRAVSQELHGMPTFPLPLPTTDGFTGRANETTQRHHDKIMLPTMEGLSFEKVKHILYLEASGNYTLIHFTDGRQTLVCRSLCEIENKLPSNAFVRIHRSHTIHLSHLKKYVRGKGGHVVLCNGILLAVSSGQKEHFMEALEQFFS